MNSDDSADIVSSDSEFSDMLIEDPVESSESETDTNDKSITQTSAETSKNGEYWFNKPTIQIRRFFAENIFKYRAGFSKQALRKADTPLMAFSNYINEEILDKILISTNNFILEKKKRK